MQRIHWIDPTDPILRFPPVTRALSDPDGLLAAGGDLSPQRLLLAYRSGIFPWYETGQPILWWSPDPRCVLLPEHLRIARSLRKTLRHRGFEVDFDRDFESVIETCAAPRQGAHGTWITTEMIEAYMQLHTAGHAHSVEVRLEDRLVGGLYGVAIGRVFFGESMFSRVNDASKVALVHLARHLHAWGYPLIDCQVENPHLLSLGAVCIPRDDFIRRIGKYCGEPPHPTPWTIDPSLNATEWKPAD